MDVTAASSSNVMPNIPIQLPKRSILMPIDNNDQDQRASLSKRKRINEFVDKVSSAEKIAIDSQLIKFLCGCNIPFDVLDSIHFKDFIKLLRPAYNHPSKSMINNTLNSVYDELTTNLSMCEQSEGILMISSTMISQSIDSKYIVGIVHRKCKKNLFLKIWTIPINANDAKDIIHDAIQISKEKYKVDIYAVIVGDDLYMSTNYGRNDPWVFKCQTTVITKIVNLFKNIPFISNVRSVLNGFQIPRLKEEIINRGGVEYEKIDEEASILSLKDMFITCLKNKPVFEQIITEDVFRIPNNVITILLNINTFSPTATSFEEELRKYILLCEQLCSLISKCQDPCSTICDIIELWLQIESIIAGENSMIEIYKEIQDILSPILLVANSLHPVYRGLAFEHNAERNVEIVEYLLTVLDDQELNDFYEYSKKKGLFEKLEIHKIKDPEKYWDFASKKYPNLANFAIKITQIPASVSQVKFQVVRCDTCDNISPDNNNNKIVELYYRLKLQDEHVTDKY